MEKITIYTDGACSGNPGPGGWGCILMHNGNKKELSGGSKDTTNNIMEITSDSAYVVNAFNQGWIYNWLKKGWKTAGGEPVKNKELWVTLYELTKIHKVTFHKVKGHADNEYNNRCDELARAAISNL